MSAKRKLTDKSSSPSAQPVVKYKRTCQQPANKSTNDTLTKEEYLKLKLYLKEKKKILKVSTFKKNDIFCIYNVHIFNNK